MKKSEVKVGGHYIANVSGRKVVVRIDSIDLNETAKHAGYDYAGNPKPRRKYSHTGYSCTNLCTGRKVSFKSAQKFLRPSTPEIAEIYKTQGKTAPNAAATKPAKLIEPADKPRETSTSEASSGIGAIRAKSRAGFDDDSLASGDAPHVIVEALAGTGKTTTFETALQYMKGELPKITPSPQQQVVWDRFAESSDAESIAMVAFNAAIAKELQNRVGKYATACTVHAMGRKAVFSAIRLRSGKDSVTGWKVADVVQKIAKKPRNQINPSFMSSVVSLVGLCKSNLVGEFDGAEYAVEPEELDRLASRYDIEIDRFRKWINKMVPMVLTECANVSDGGYIDYNDMVWLPIVRKLSCFRYDLLCIDECFPAGTMIQTSEGPVAIEKIAEDSTKEWEVLSRVAVNKTLRYSSVRKAYKTPTSSNLVKVYHAEGQITCTANHPLWTQRGWVAAGLLCEGDTVFYLRDSNQSGRSNLLPEVCGGVEKIAPSNSVGGNRETTAGQNQKTYEGDLPPGNRNPAQPDGAGGCSVEGISDVQTAGYTSDGSRGQRSGSVGTPVVTLQRVMSSAPRLAMEPRTCRVEWSKSYLFRERVADLLQNRHRVVEEENRSRSGWGQSSKSPGADNRREERFSLVGARVDYVEVLERGDTSECSGSGSEGTRYVYTLNTEEGNYIADGVLVKNCQDLNAMQHELVIRCGRRLIFCGDKNQAIYGFTGADSQSLETLYTRLSASDRKCVRVPLTVTRRCGKRIVKEAQRLVPKFEAHSSNPEGEAVEAVFAKKASGREGYEGTPEENPLPDYRTLVRPGDMVICRVNAPLVSECFQAISRGVKARIQGRNIGDKLAKLIDDLAPPTVTDLHLLVGKWCKAELDKEAAQENPDENRMINIQDKHDCILALSEGAEAVFEVTAKIEEMFTDDGNDANCILYTSGHKSKGLEAKRVFLLMHDKAPIPHPMAKQPWAREQEWSLLYVMITRAIEYLCYVR